MKFNKSCVCNNCEKEFTPDFQVDKIKKHGGFNDVEIMFFCCPHCEKRYNSYIEDAKYREMLKEYRRLGRAVKRIAESNKNKAQFDAACRKLANYEKKTMKPHAELLKREFKNYG